MPPLERVVAERELGFTHHSGETEVTTVSLGAPVFRDGTWWCPYKIHSQSFSHSYALAGEDSLQALLGSACILATELDALARRHNGIFTYFGDNDLMLPSMDWIKRGGDAGEN